jgi:ABC-type dipeptide/oligopeptide/nickel transport system permease subunit
MAASPSIQANVGLAAPQPVSKGLARPPRTYLREVVARLSHNRTALLGVAFILFLIAIAITTPWIAPYDYSSGSLLDANQLPSRAHWLGTDALGRDELTRLMWGARVSLTVAIGAQIIVLLIGVSVGLVSGFFGGWIDYLVMRLVDALYSLPSLLVAILVMSFLRGVLSTSTATSALDLGQINAATGGLLGIFIVLFVTHWLTVCRLVRAQVMTIKEREFVLAARAIGAGRPRTMRVHLLPHVLAPVLVAITFGIPGSISLEASLSFLGIGVIPPMPSWGTMIAESLPSMRTYPWLLFWPGAALALTLLSFTYVGDALRDALDPLMKR